MPGPFDELEREAENLEKQSKGEFNRKNFLSAINILKEAQEIYSKLGFHGKIDMIKKRIAQLMNVIKHQKQSTDMKAQNEEILQQRVDKVLKEKESLSNQKLVEQGTLSPEIKKNLEKIDLLLEKAKKEEKLGNYSRVIKRYQFIIELYKSIPKEVMNCSNEITEIEKKLTALQSK
ncbi:hypothetical protein LCGC14_0761130 [marine sediment metagenome]|uniref:Uncharacterized protein n=1 Tax=marine sediment metagenome TaxID=412755 RepID=A0A0F9SL38_9ZZZZ